MKSLIENIENSMDDDALDENCRRRMDIYAEAYLEFDFIFMTRMYLHMTDLSETLDERMITDGHHRS